MSVSIREQCDLAFCTASTGCIAWLRDWRRGGGEALRAPFFSDGLAATLLDVVNFYDKRFAINFSASEKKDLVNFLNSL